MEITGRDLARVLSPLGLWALHLVYLAAWSPDPFLTRWLEGSFSFFLALVLCNVVRSRIAAAAAASRAERDGEAGGDETGGDSREG